MPLRWHPRFFAHQTSDGQVVLLEDGDAVLPVAQEEGDLALSADAYRLAAMSYLVPRFEAEPRVLETAGAEVILLSDLGESDPLVRWAKELSVTERVAVAVVDDELDPRLKSIDSRLRSSGLPWVLFKPRGKRPSIGPWFGGTAKDARWTCLERCLLDNQPVRRWLLHQSAGTLGRAIPIAVETLSPRRLPPPTRFDPGALLELDSRTGEIVRAHHVARRDHCREPLSLRSVARRTDADGGYRSHDPADTLARLERHVSPRTGSVADVSLLPGVSREQVPIHRSAFLTCPLSKRVVRPADFHRVALGKGIFNAQSRASALCEALERSIAQYRGDEPTLPLGEELIHWVEVHSLTHQRADKVPVTSVYANTPFAREEELHGFDTNGCAAGRTLEEALLQGLLEVIERDAVAVWWYNRIARPALPLSLLGKDLLESVSRTLEPRFDYWILDVTHDVDVPAVVAVARRHSDGQFRLGFGCHLEAGIAAQRAVTELCQLIAIGDQRGAVFDFAAIADEPYLHPAPAPPDVLPAIAASTSYQDIRAAVERCVERLRDRALEALVYRYPSIDDALVVVKAIVPGACHIWRKHGAPRLTKVPVDCGWAPRPLSAEDLNPLSLLV